VLSNTAELAAALVVARTTPAPATRTATLRVWRVAILIAAPLMAAWAAVALVGPEYTGAVLIKAHADADAKDPNRLALLADGLGQQLSGLVWGDRPQTTSSAQTASVLGGFAGPAGHSVRLARDGADFRMQVTSSSRFEVQQQLQWLAEQYNTKVLKPAELESARIARERLTISQRVDQWERDLAALSWHSGAADSLTTPGGEKDFALLIELRGRFHAARQTLEDRRLALAESIRSRDELRLAPLPTAAIVAPTAREEAYSADRVLQEDSRHLRVQLLQLRSAILQIGDDSTAAMNEVLRLSDELSRILDSPDAANADPARRILFERIAEGAGELHGKSAAFAHEWSDQFAAVQTKAVDPQKRDILDAYAAMTRAQGDFNYALNRILNSLRLRLQTLAEHTEDEARSHVLNAEVVRLFHELQAAYRRFATTSGGLQSRDNYVLNAALDTVQALTQRTSRAREALDTRLEGAALQQARADRLARLAAADARIEETRTDVDNLLDGLSELHGSLAEMLDRLPNMVRADADREAAARERVRLEPLVTEARERIRQLDAAAAVIVDPQAVAVTVRPPGDYPDNSDRLLIAGAAGWLGTVALVLALSHSRSERLA
jgi:hypothetical protein